MPLAQRVVDKCADLVRRQMRSVGAQQITLPVLTPSALWKKSGRLDGDITEFYLLKDRHGKQFILSPVCYRFNFKLIYLLRNVFYAC